MNKSSGILLHISSLPSKDGIGDFGEGAYKFIDFLSSSGQSYWQILPYHPVGFGYSPYQAYSVFAGDPLFISLDKLYETGLLTCRNDTGNFDKEFPGKCKGRLDNCLSDERVNYPAVEQLKHSLYRNAYYKFNKLEHFKTKAYHEFNKQHSFWLDDFCLFMALKAHFNGRPWYEWEDGILSREQKALEFYKNELKEEIDFHRFLQYQFFTQWEEVKSYANEKGIKVIGDIPIFVAHDSADTWSNPDLFKLDEAGHPLSVAGVPPDYFSESGQRWGNPLYNWKSLKESNYLWWRKRFSLLLEQVDIVRIDHFRGFESYYEIPAEEETAINGKWVKGPGREFFRTIEKYLGELPVIAEDLGIITPEVNELRKDCGFPGMKVLIFLLETGATELFESLFTENVVLYSGTHDNDTFAGWLKKARLDSENSNNEQPKPDYDFVVKTLDKYFQISDEMTDSEVSWKMLKVLMKSSSILVMLPMQDILMLDNEARMNVPGTVGGNWIWRVTENELNEYNRQWLLNLTKQSGRSSL